MSTFKAIHTVYALVENTTGDTVDIRTFNSEEVEFVGLVESWIRQYDGTEWHPVKMITPTVPDTEAILTDTASKMWDTMHAATPQSSDQWTWDTMPDQQREDYKQTMRFIVENTVKAVTG